MKKYTTIFIDIDNITFELYNNRYMHPYAINMMEQILKKGLNSLKDFEVIALLGKNEVYGKSYIMGNHLEHVKYISREELDIVERSTTTYIQCLLRYFNRSRKEVLVVSGNPNRLNTAKLLNIDTCYFNIFNTEPLEDDTNITINKLEELRKYRLEYKQPKDNISLTEINPTQCNFYIDLKLLQILEDNKIVLKKYDTDKEKFLSYKSETDTNLAITTNPMLAKFFKQHGCFTYFVNNHQNDNADFIADFESPIEKLPKQLEKILKK